MVDEDAAVGAGERAENIGVGMPGIVATHTAEVIMRTDHGLGIPPLTLEQKHPESQCVGETPDKQYPPSPLLRKILMKQEQVVAEIKISLLGIPFGQGGSPHMKHVGIRDGADPVAGRYHAAT